MPVQGILDLLDKADEQIRQIDLTETLDPSRIRRNQNHRKSARDLVQEIRRRIERVGQETKT